MITALSNQNHEIEYPQNVSRQTFERVHACVCIMMAVNSEARRRCFELISATS